jgi:NAD(P)-dependent dehydrogenase (short-subunit alcohol dehydrogenase family)
MLTNMTEAEWDAVINVHLKGSFAPMHHAAAYWKGRHKDGHTEQAARIVNTTSVSGLFGNVGQTNYGAAKAGIAAMTVIAARELRRYDVTVNAISPHAHTRMTDGLRPLTDEEQAQRDPRWIAPVVVWLVSRDSGAVTGRIIEVGGGMLGITEGWRPGPQVGQMDDPRAIGPVLTELVAKAHPNVGMSGKPADI